MTKLRAPSFWVSLALHLALLLLYLFYLNYIPKEEKKYVPPYVPAYTYTPKASSYKPLTATAPLKAEAAQKSPEIIPDQKEGEIRSAKKEIVKQVSFSKSLLASSLTSLKQEQMKSLTKKSDEDPVLLIGDMSQEADPLIKLMGRSLSAHFKYPETEGRLGIKGKVLIGLTLYPDGHFGNIEIVRTSNNHHFDAAALYASNTAPSIYGADRFISKPKRFVIGFIFD